MGKLEVGNIVFGNPLAECGQTLATRNFLTMMGGDSFQKIDHLEISSDTPVRVFENETSYSNNIPTVRVTSTESEHFLEFYLPGVSKEDVSVEITDSGCLYVQLHESDHIQPFKMSIQFDDRSKYEVHSIIKAGILTVTVPRAIDKEGNIKTKKLDVYDGDREEE